MVRDVAAHREPRQIGEETVRERRLLLGVDVSLARHRRRSVHADLRCEPHLGLDRARARAVREQSSHPSARRLRGSVLPAALRPTRTALTRKPDAAGMTLMCGNPAIIASMERGVKTSRSAARLRETAPTYA